MVFLTSDEKQSSDGEGVEIKHVIVDNGKQNLPQQHMLY